ncbi:copper resistance protein CopC [Thermomicrobiaceae bacterium CFH 74404]|uniref:Copper resistance protein CopC n=1 Tax=Thermalbibacter longus TaxID=2951981 RepID=A0AA42B9X2_9BACT|nr:copper resistance protein CopC [Thermalbibacter longus]MCM8747795.1 copper resistance protein CopC [Thermalbibacter longus]
MKRRARRGGRRLATVLATLLILIGLPAGIARGHAFLERSDPAANAVVPQVPGEVRMWFTEPLEAAYSRAELFDAQGQRIETEPSHVGTDPKELVLPLPPDLPRGTYTVQWRNVSAADGHPQVGFFSFTVGTVADVQVPAPPPPLPVGFAPTWLDALGRWFGLLGLTGLLGALVCWRWVIRPSLEPLEPDRRERVAAAVRALSLAGLALASIGSLVGLGVQAWNAEGQFSLAGIWGLLSGSRFGLLWSLRVALLLALGGLLARHSAWHEPPSGRRVWLCLGLGLAAALAYSSMSHAAAQPAGRPAAVAADWLHLVAASVWVGGLLALLAGLILVRRGEIERWREVYALAIPRFSTLAIASVAILTLTGLYSAWLQVGNLEALRSTGYGRALLVKLALVLVLLELGAINLLVTGPRMRRSVDAPRHFGYTVLAEAVLGIAVLLVVGVLTSLPPARDTLAASSGRASFHFAEGEVHASLQVSPGAVGFNRYTVDLALAGQDVPEGTQVLLRVTPPGNLEGVREIELARQASTSGQQARFEASGSELSVVGAWELELIVRRPNAADWRVSVPLEVAQAPPTERQPGPPPRFAGLTAAAAVAGLGMAIMLLTVGLRRRDPQGNGRFLAELGAGLALVCAVALLVSRLDQTPGVAARNPIPATPESIAAGQELFVANCAVCHGASGRGDGPAAASLDWPQINMDLTAHLYQHTDGDLYWWIREGKAGTPMPGFKNQLADEEIWHLVNYLRTLDRRSAP